MRIHTVALGDEKIPLQLRYIWLAIVGIFGNKVEPLSEGPPILNKIFLTGTRRTYSSTLSAKKHTHLSINPILHFEDKRQQYLHSTLVERSFTADSR